MRLKGLINLVTEADIMTEKAVVGVIRERYPDHQIMAEEGVAEEGILNHAK